MPPLNLAAGISFLYSSLRTNSQKQNLLISVRKLKKGTGCKKHLRGQYDNKEKPAGKGNIPAGFSRFLRPAGGNEMAVIPWRRFMMSGLIMSPGVE